MRPPRANAYRDAWCGELRAGDVDHRVRVAGWVHRRRDHGGLIFIDLRDRTGLLQLVFRPEEAPEAHAAAGRLRPEDVVSATGELVRREEGTVNPNLPTGEIELAVDEFDLLADSKTPPFQIDEDDPVGEELRLRYRYLDLRKEPMRDNLVLPYEGICVSEFDRNQKRLLLDVCDLWISRLPAGHSSLKMDEVERRSRA